jgi:hypothetical protein
LTGGESNYLINLVPRRKLVVLLAGFLFVVGGTAAVVIGLTGRESLTGNRPAAGPVGSTSAPQPTPTIATPPPAPAVSVVAIPAKSPVAPPASAKAHTDTVGTAAGHSDPNDRIIHDRVNEPPINSRPQAPSFPIYTTHSVSTPTPIPNPAETAPPYSR